MDEVPAAIRDMLIVPCDPPREYCRWYDLCGAEPIKVLEVYWRQHRTIPDWVGTNGKFLFIKEKR